MSVSNLEGQTDVVGSNMIRLLYTTDITNTLLEGVPKAIIQQLRERAREIRKPEGTFDINDVTDLFEFQKDLGALILLSQEGEDLSNYTGDTTDFYTIAEEFIKERRIGKDGEPIAFPQMVQDVIIAIESGGEKPPAAEMQTIVDFYQDRVAGTV